MTLRTFGISIQRVFQECDLELQQQRVLLYIIVFIGLGVVMLITMFFQSFLFSCSGERLTERLRSKAFNVMLRQDMKYFDDPENNTGALCTRLSTEAAAVQGVGVRIGTILENLSNLGVGIILSFVYGWTLALVVLGFVPCIIVAGFLQIYLMSRFASKDKETCENASKLAIEVIQNIRTVKQLTKENDFVNDYCCLLDVPYKSSMRRAHLFAFLFSFTNSIMFFVLAAVFSFGGYLVDQNRMTFEDVLLVYNCLVFGAEAVGQAMSIIPGYGKAISAAENLIGLFDSKVTIYDNDDDPSKTKSISDFHGELQLDNVSFAYPNRSDSLVLDNFSLTAKPGASGCGKSTIIQLILRFYDPHHGHLRVDQHDIRSLNLKWFRSQVGFVGQEPILFNMTIAENIAYGDTSRKISKSEIEQAATDANIHEFISNELPEKYDTKVGSKGHYSLSGGQKQRIAIARTLIRNPKILLLDEATSALDAKNEKDVQEALDRAQKHRTSITIAHRLSTIQDADFICFVHNGRVTESGTHSQLLGKRGLYYNLAKRS
ncbi:unnamed protein product [Didymodactylos carnosus]|uniref:Uncharacterized protein n=1 Tax=Didymodactylos carnosus TaxID=1234261 RepID=A0A815ESZ6_9BILA|nr:unnamed protein product [Didymodactylos carnosus]CAF4164196.1 unnamed protein product [Didymodactylos carnosus]